MVENKSAGRKPTGTAWCLKWTMDLMRDIGTGVTDVPVHLPHDSNVLVAV